MIYIASYPSQSGLEVREEEESVNSRSQSMIRAQQTKRQVQHNLGLKLLSFGLEKEYGIFPEVNSLEKGSYGKPYLKGYPDIQFSISHCEGLAGCVLCNGTVGLDAELIRPYNERVADRILTDKERSALKNCGSADNLESRERFFRYWTLKESYVKAIGKGLSFPFREIEFEWNGKGEIMSNHPEFVFYQTRLYGRYILSLCVSQEYGNT